MNMFTNQWKGSNRKEIVEYTGNKKDTLIIRHNFIFRLLSIFKQVHKYHGKSKVLFNRHLQIFSLLKTQDCFFIKILNIKKYSRITWVNIWVFFLGLIKFCSVDIYNMDFRLKQAGFGSL